MVNILFMDTFLSSKLELPKQFKKVIGCRGSRKGITSRATTRDDRELIRLYQ